MSIFSRFILIHNRFQVRMNNIERVQKLTSSMDHNLIFFKLQAIAFICQLNSVKSKRSSDRALPKRPDSQKEPWPHTYTLTLVRVSTRIDTQNEEKERWAGILPDLPKTNGAPRTSTIQRTF